MKKRLSTGADRTGRARFDEYACMSGLTAFLITVFLGLFLPVQAVEGASRSDQSIPDSEIVQQVKDAFLQDFYVDRSKIEVWARKGTVYLSGKVDSAFEKGRAKDLVAGVRGVTEVVNNISAPTTWTWSRDWEVRLDIERKLEMSPLVEGDAVKVTVVEGVATLSGTVDTWQERDVLTEKALQGGAKTVNNNLVVRQSR
jgi:osmotically-inducible protein OsmY